MADITYLNSGKPFVADAQADMAMLDYALAYARIGWHVFPCRPGTKDPATGDGGFYHATTDVDQITTWWQRWPDANIGWYPSPSGHAVLDSDVKDGQTGPDELQALEDKRGELPDTLNAETPSGGMHYIFKCAQPLPNNKLSASIDVRSGAGYILLEPSIADGKPYQFNDWCIESDGSPGEQVAELPQWVIDEQYKRSQRSAQGGEDQTLTYEPPQDMDALQTQFDAYLAHHPKVRARYNGDTSGLNDTTGSAMDFSMVAMMKRGGFTFSQIWVLLDDWQHGSSSKDRDGIRYWRRLYSRTSDPERAEPTYNTPVDLFADYPVPPFPLEVLPEVLQRFAHDKASQSGFDPGAYGFSLLITAANSIDHRTRLDVGPFKVPAFQFGGLVGVSGYGKSPIMRDCKRAVERINEALVHDSRCKLAEWRQQCEAARKDKAEQPVKPPWKQRHALDTTVEALANLLVDNPEGINFYFDEITEFLGRMDAYSGKGGEKDRGVYLRAYDGGQVPINRATKDPLVVDDFTVGILAGIQPEVLASKFKKSGSGGGSDGLYQRFLMYCIQPAGEADYAASTNPLVEANVDVIFQTLHSQIQDGATLNAQLSGHAKRMMQRYHNNIRTLGRRTAGKRFAEHLDKFPGFVGRIAFTLHIIHAVACGDHPDGVVSGETMQQAIAVARVLYRHSESVYGVLDDIEGEVQQLAQTAAEAILSKGWTQFKRGDLTRDATYWQGSAREHAENAIDLLIEYGWIADVTPTPESGRRGRKSDGAFAVNPAVHDKFKERTNRIKTARAERYKALQAVASGN